MVILGSGNALEWFGWVVFVSTAPFFSEQIFAHSSPLSAILATFAVFAVGFVARPLGAALLAHLADRRGRVIALALSIACVAAGSIGVALLPTYQSIGDLSGVLLLCLRLLQGLGEGGELPTAQTYVAEIAPRGRRGLWSSMIYLSGQIGVICGLALPASLSWFLGAEAMSEWGWRVPFAVGGIAGLAALAQRMTLQEPPSSASVVRSRDAHRTPWGLYRQRALQICGLVAGPAIVAYSWGAAAPAYATTILGVNPTAALWAAVGAYLLSVASLPAWATLSDRYGRKPNLLIGALGCAAAVAPMELLLRSSAWQLFVAMSVILVLQSATLAIAPALFAELFPTHIRVRGMALPYAITVALFGGTAPYVETWLTAHHHPHLFTAATIVALLVSAGTALTLPETVGTDLEAVT
ncbi:hypothetical protein BI330_06795 [Mycobacterium sp. CBMA 623]|nr:hypothetical protein [Mycobacteroides sp. CBMA 326]